MRFATPLLLATLLAGCAPAPATPRVEGQAAPDFSVTTLDGTTLSLAGLKGKVIVVNFWATWCPPCRTEIPAIAGFYAAHRSEGLEIIGLSADRMTANELKPYIAALKINYPVAMATAKLIRDFAPGDSIPTTFVIDKQGKIRDKRVGGIDRETLEELFTKLSAER